MHKTVFNAIVMAVFNAHFIKAVGRIMHAGKLVSEVPIAAPPAKRAWQRLEILTALCLSAIPFAAMATKEMLGAANFRPSNEESLPLRERLSHTPAQAPPNGDGPTAPTSSALVTLAKHDNNTYEPTNTTGGHKEAGRTETLLLELYVNNQALPSITRVEQLTDGRLVLPIDAWTATRLIPPAGEHIVLSDGERGYAIQDVADLRFDLNRSLQTLHIIASASAFAKTSLALGAGQEIPPKPSPPGVYLNYDASVTHATGHLDGVGIVVEGIAFSGADSLVSGAVLAYDGRTRQTIRTDTYVRRDLPGRMEALVLGDAIGSGGAWSRPVRYGGIRFARDFSLAPGYVTYPTPTLRGSAALPSTVDMIINNQRRSSTLTVSPGPFDLTNVPVSSGSGEVNLVVRDLRGVETVITQKYYLSPRLLAPGLSDFSLDAGRLRRNFGLPNSDYGPGFAAATYRYGLTSTLTGEGRVEVQKSRQAAGFEVAGLIGELGSVQATAAWSRSDSDGRDTPRSGGRYLLGFERSAQNGGGGSLQWEHFDAGFRQFGDLGSEARPRDRMQAQTGMSLAQLSLGLSYIRQTTWNGDNFRLLALNVGTPILDRLFLSFYANKRLGPEGGWSAGLSLLMPLEKQRSVIATSNRDNDGRYTTTVHASQSPPVGPGLGWRVRASDQARQQAQAGATVNSNFGQFQAEANGGSGGSAIRLGASGSAGWLAGLPFATRRIDHGAFAVVRVADLEGVPVYRSNQIAATTNKQGMALVTGLQPYQKNLLSIDPDGLPFNMQIGGVEELVTPYARSGSFVDFPVRHMRNALVVIVQPDGAPVPPGTLVTLASSAEPFIVGKRGEVYLTDLNDSNKLRVTSKTGTCELTFALDPATASEPRIGPLTCVPAKLTKNAAL